ncbi:DUF1217 domain-containing protein [Nisaea nitritireducens]|uniref:DUF1217 domain-containing protein n=1 Tax=Nisaea nitritireducens TaxID=568392 RepID=UPI0018676D04|nr:DUF1217 domain-containing protein [Nisaea nitritireducens]
MTNAAAALSILGGSFNAGSGGTTTGVAAFAKYKRDPEGARRDFYESAAVQKNIKSFQSSANEINSLEDFLADRKTLEFVLTAFGLESELNNPGKLKAIINSDPDDVNSYANRLADSRYGELAKFLNVKNEGFTKLQSADAQTEVIDDYLTNAFEVSIGLENPAAREAVFFLRRVNEIDSALEILGDLPLRNIVTTALGLPAQIAKQSVLKQQSLIDAKLDFDKLNTLDREEENASKTKLDLVNDDLSAVKTGLAAVTNASLELSTVQQQLEDLRIHLQDIDNITDPGGVLADEIPVQEAAIPELIRQQGLIAAAEKALLSTDPNLTRIDAIFKEAANVETQEELDGLKSEFDRLVTEITSADGFIKGSNYSDSTAGTTENLLLPSGDGGSGIDALPSAKATTVVKSDGTAVVTSSLDLSDFLTNLDNTNTAFQAINLGSLSSDISSAKTDFEAVESDFKSAQVQNGVNASSFAGSVSGVNFGYSLNTQSLSQGISAVDDGLTRLSKAAAVISEIRTLAFNAQAEDADIDELNTTYGGKLEELASLINDAGTATDGTNTFTFDNLLTGGTISYEADAASGKSIDARGGALDTVILGALPTTLSAGNANGILSDIDTTVTDSLSELKDNLVTDRKIFDFAANVADPLGAIDAEIRQISGDLDALIERAGDSGDNLLKEFGNDLKVVLGTLSTTITVDAQGGFKEDFENALSSLQYVAVSGGVAASRESILNDALFSVGSTLSRLNAEKFTLNIQNSILGEKKSSLTNTSGSAESLDFLKPLENTNYAIKFIEQYLVKKDLEAIGGSTTTQPKNASLVGLFQDISGGGGLLNLLS